MSDKKMHFIGFLTNADASILQLSLNHGFRIEALSKNEALDFIIAVAKVSLIQATKILFMQFPCLNQQEEQVYVISNSLEGNAKTEKMDLWNKIVRFDNKLVHGYLNPSVRLMRLFKEGDLRMSLRYYYTVKNGKPSPYMSTLSGRYVSRESYHLESSELQNLHNFLHETKIPFERAFLQLAFENFELSYEISNIGLSFLTLMISLETLLNPGKQELKYRISRNAAVLLGNDRENSRAIFSEIRELYDKRSKVVHTGDSKIIKRDVLLKLRHYVRETIKKIYLMKKCKDETLDILNSCGFGEGVMP